MTCSKKLLATLAAMAFISTGMTAFAGDRDSELDENGDLPDQSQGVAYMNGTAYYVQDGKTIIKEGDGSTHDCTKMTDECMDMLKDAMDSGELTTFGGKTASDKKTIGKLKADALKIKKGQR